MISKIKEIREQMRMTQQELADKSEISKRSIINYEKSERYPTVDRLVKIANALGTDWKNLYQQ